MLSNRKGQWALIEIVIVLAIIAVAAYFIYPKYLASGKSTKKSETVAAPTVQAESVACKSNLTQVRSAINMFQQSNENMPATLSDLASVGVTAEISKCPVSGQSYKYDASQGKVSCTTPGHEAY